MKRVRESNFSLDKQISKLAVKNVCLKDAVGRKTGDQEKAEWGD